MKPIVHPLPDSITVAAAFDSLSQPSQPSRRSRCLLLESSRQLQSERGVPLGRYSFLMSDPFAWIEIPCSVGNPHVLDPIAQILKQYCLEHLPGLPPFQGGLAGLLSYDLGRSFEHLPPQGRDHFRLPAIAMGAYDLVLAWDHQLNQAWIISSGLPETEESARVGRAKARIDQVLKWLVGSAQPDREQDAAKLEVFEREMIERIAKDERFLLDDHGLSSNFSAAGFQQAVQQVVDLIYQGECFQVNLAQQLVVPANCSPEVLYRRLRASSPAPFSGYFDTRTSATKPPIGLSNGAGPDAESQTFQIVSSSPERLISVRGRRVETRPIKGTRPRSGDPLIDQVAADELLASEKDRAENVMIVDLLRNDLSLCCHDDSITVTQLCELEKYANVMHLVSAVEGELKPDVSLTDLIKAVFPGGSVTGAPKYRSMQIIDELEPDLRGAYCGSLGYLGFDGSADLSILIRTITASNGLWQIPVGGGIVSDSNPEAEYVETWDKATGMLDAIMHRRPLASPKH